MNSRIYIVQVGICGPIKIGKAMNVDKRLETLQTGNHKRLKLVDSFGPFSPKKAAFVEKMAHRRFSENRIRGEWFSPVVLKRAKKFLVRYEAVD